MVLTNTTGQICDFKHVAVSVTVTWCWKYVISSADGGKNCLNSRFEKTSVILECSKSLTSPRYSKLTCTFNSLHAALDLEGFVSLTTHAIA